MLVLTRKRSEMIRIGDEIVIKVIKTGKTTVKIGVEAPGHVRVLRAELCENEGHATQATPEMHPLNMDEFDVEQLTLSCSDQFPHVA
jgi:carbon storage regulator